MNLPEKSDILYCKFKINVDGQRTMPCPMTKIVLVIDCDASCRSVIKKTLAPDYIVLEAAKGADAIHLISSSVTMILLNHELPDIDGLVFCRLLRQKKLPTIPLILMLTTPLQPHLIAEAFDVGCYDFISKPINTTELRARISNVLKQKRFHDHQNFLISNLRERSEKDPLTHLHNRHVLKDYATKEIAKAVRTHGNLSLLMIDIDHFKAVNDVYGHPIGDHVLVQLSHRMVEQLRRYDIIVRYGGDEFVVLLPGTMKDAATIVAEKIEGHVSGSPFATKKGNVSITLSIGVAEWKIKTDCHLHQEEVLEYLLLIADHNLRFAKKNGRNQVIAAEIPFNKNFKLKQERLHENLNPMDSIHPLHSLSHTTPISSRNETRD